MVCGDAALPLRAPATPHTSAGPAENQGRRPRSSPAAVLMPPETVCGRLWHLAAAYGAAWIYRRAVARCKQCPKRAPSRPATPHVEAARADRGTARHGLAARGGRFRPRRNPQSVARRALEAAPPRGAGRVPSVRRLQLVFRVAGSREHVSRSPFLARAAHRERKSPVSFPGRFFVALCRGRLPWRVPPSPLLQPP